MRILVVANLYPSRRHPAFGTFVAERVAALRAAGAEVTVVAIESPDVHRRLAAKYLSLGVRAAMAALGLAIRRRRPAVVEAHIAYPTGLIAWPIARLIGARLVLFAHGTDVREVAWQSRVSTILARRLFRSADLVIANSSYLAGVIRDRLALRPNALRIVSPGIALERFREAALETREGFLFVGRLVPDKGAADLLEALDRIGASNLPQWHPLVRIVGSGPQRQALVGLATERNLDAQFDGAVGRDAVAAAMGSAAIVAVPSTHESLGLVAIEAMASGAIVVASLTGGLADTVQEGANGFTFTTGDIDSLVDAIRRALAALDEPATASAIRSAARRTAEDHSADRWAAASLAMYAELAA